MTKYNQSARGPEVISQAIAVFQQNAILLRGNDIVPIEKFYENNVKKL